MVKGDFLLIGVLALLGLLDQPAQAHSQALNLKQRSRKKDELSYTYPRGESYLDVIQRLEPVIIGLDRQRAPVVVISHQAVYFTDRPLEEIPHIEVPLHTIIEIQMGVTGVEETIQAHGLSAIRYLCKSRQSRKLATTICFLSTGV